MIVYLPCGEKEYIWGREDYTRIIKERLGDDFGQTLAEEMTALERAADGVDTDLRSYELSLDSKNALLCELIEKIESVDDLMQQSRINRAKVRELLDEILEQIYKEV